MSVLNLPSGPYTSCWIGDYGAGFSSQVLVKISSIRVDGTAISDVTETEWVQSLGTRAQTGPREIKFQLSFYTDNSMPYRLCRNIRTTDSLNTTSDPSYQYVLMLINSDTTKNSWLFPQISAELDLEVNYNKDKPTTTVVNFVATAIVLSTDIMSVGTASAVNALLPSARRPF